MERTAVDPKRIEELRNKVAFAARQWFRARSWVSETELMKQAEDLLVVAAQEYNSAMDVDEMLAGLRGEDVSHTGIHEMIKHLKKEK